MEIVPIDARRLAILATRPVERDIDGHADVNDDDLDDLIREAMLPAAVGSGR